MRMHDIMSKNVITIAPETTVALARETLRSREINHLVVTDGKRIAGVISEKDLTPENDHRAIRDVMTRVVVTIEPQATLRRAAGVMRGRAIGCLPVVDDTKLVGIVTKSDFLTALAKGEIHAAPPDARVILRKRGERKRPAPI